MQCPSCSIPVEDSLRFCPQCGTVLVSGTGTQVRDPLIGQVLGGKYTVVRLLGEGGMGAVYEGEQQLGTSKRKVAVKTLHPHLSRDEKIKARFEREVGTVAELEHPNTIQVYDFGTAADGILYIVMEFLHGRSLADLIEKEGALAPERAQGILEQICGSLEEAHGRGIVHRDLKPDNVVLVERAGKKDFVKVLDFGIAKRSREEDKAEQKLTQQGMVLGTPPYMSPEQFTGNPIDLRSDIYSLGVMAYEMLSGKLPFHANTAWEWATQHMTQPPIPIESLAEGARVNEAVRATLRRALAKAPADRFQTVHDFFAAFSGAAPLGGPTMMTPATQVRGKTEVGAPLDVAAAFGGPAVTAHGYTPVGGNVAFPTPAGIPQPEPLDVVASAGSGRGKLLAAAGIIAVASAAAIAFALKGPGSKPVVFDNASASGPAPATSLSAGSAAGEAPSPSDTPAGEVPPLKAAGAHAATTHDQGHPASSASPSAIPSASQANAHVGSEKSPFGSETSPFGPEKSPYGPPGPAGTPTHSPASPQGAPAPPGQYDGPECARARMLRGIGRRHEAQQWALTCLAKGGNPD
jgi:eukaryotic-like serine/threonine-protein kinase